MTTLTLDDATCIYMLSGYHTAPYGSLLCILSHCWVTSETWSRHK